MLLFHGPRPEEPQGSIHAEHATDLGEGGIGIEVVERVPDHDGVGDPVAERIPSAVPATIVTSGGSDAMIARMLAAGSIATTRTPSDANRRESWPVPAARSTRSDPGCNLPRSATQPTAAGA